MRAGRYRAKASGGMSSAARSSAREERLTGAATPFGITTMRDSGTPSARASFWRCDCVKVMKRAVFACR